MRKTLTLLLLLAVLLPSCLKDELDTATLTTNPLDLDYIGTPLLVLILDSTLVYTDTNNVPIDTLLYQRVHVRTELLPPLTTWIWSVKNITTNQVTTGTNQGTYDYHLEQRHSGNDSLYGYEYTLLVEFHVTKPYRFYGSDTY